MLNLQVSTQPNNTVLWISTFAKSKLHTKKSELGDIEIAPHCFTFGSSLFSEQTVGNFQFESALNANIVVWNIQ